MVLSGIVVATGLGFTQFTLSKFSFAAAGSFMYHSRLQQNKSITAQDFHQTQQPALAAALPSTGL